jgi:triosephosphate isomerase
MTPGVRPLVAGNWKMNGLSASLVEVTAMAEAVEAGKTGEAELAVCPPATLLAQAAWALRGSKVSLGGQDCSAKESGAFTGDIAAPMIKDAGASYVIVGHSERRQYHGENDAAVKAKAEAALKAGLTAIVCVGETRAEREAGKAIEVVNGQVRGSLPAAGAPETVVVAYEPVWAIGTGLTPTLADIAEIHAAIRASAPADTRILYGGSMNPKNAAEILAIPGVGGGLIGGASLKAEDFWAIVEAAR